MPTQMYELTPEAREMPTDELTNYLGDGPKSFEGIMENSGLDREQTANMIRAYMQRGIIRRVEGAPETAPQQKGPGFTLGGLEREAGDADAEMGKLISDII